MKFVVLLVITILFYIIGAGIYSYYFPHAELTLEISKSSNTIEFWLNRYQSFIAAAISVSVAYAVLTPTLKQLGILRAQSQLIFVQYISSSLIACDREIEAITLIRSYVNSILRRLKSDEAAKSILFLSISGDINVLEHTYYRISDKLTSNDDIIMNVKSSETRNLFDEAYERVNSCIKEFYIIEKLEGQRISDAGKDVELSNEAAQLRSKLIKDMTDTIDATDRHLAALGGEKSELLRIRSHIATRAIDEIGGLPK